MKASEKMTNKYIQCYCPCCGNYTMEIPLTHICPGMENEKECPRCKTKFIIKIEYNIEDG
jgi:hypothetical protein